jgi:hypothetical protein
MPKMPTLRIKNPKESLPVALPQLCRAFDVAGQMAKEASKGGAYLQWLRDELKKVYLDWGQDWDDDEARKLLRPASIGHWRKWLADRQNSSPNGFQHVLLLALAEVTGVDVTREGRLRRGEINECGFVVLNRIQASPSKNQQLYDDVDAYKITVGQLRLEPLAGQLGPWLKMRWIQGRKTGNFNHLGSYALWAQKVELEVSGLEPGVQKPCVLDARRKQNAEERPSAAFAGIPAGDGTILPEGKEEEPIETDIVLVTTLNHGEELGDGSCKGGYLQWRDEASSWVLAVQSLAESGPAPAASIDNLTICKLVVPRKSTATAKVYVRTEDIKVNVTIDRERLGESSDPTVLEKRSEELRLELIKQVLKDSFLKKAVHVISTGVLYFE